MTKKNLIYILSVVVVIAVMISLYFGRTNANSIHSIKFVRHSDWQRVNSASVGKPLDYYFINVDSLDLEVERGSDTTRKLFKNQRVALIDKNKDTAHVKTIDGIMGYVPDYTLSINSDSSVFDRLEGADYDLYLGKMREINNYQPVRAIYMSTNEFDDLDKFLDSIKNLNINTVVIDYKESHDRFLFKSEVASKYNMDYIYIFDDNSAIKKIKDRGFRLVAEISTFRSNDFVKANESEGLIGKDLQLINDRDSYLINPYSKKGWQYIADVAKEANKNGFDEIMLVGVEFPDLPDSELEYGELVKPRVEVLQNFIDFINREVHQQNMLVGVSVKSKAIEVTHDLYIGHQYEALTNRSDIINPFIEINSTDNKENLKTIKRIIDRNSSVLTPSIIRPEIYFDVKDESYFKEYLSLLENSGINEFIIGNYQEIIKEESQGS